MNKKRIFLGTLLALLVVAAGIGEETSIENLYEFQLENGLELFVVENHAAPLAYIEIAVKAGGRAQTKENAGLFHLYEHMMFKGNTKYTDAAAVQRTINDMGVASWNGTTDLEHVNYFFTVPSDLLYKGLEFWSYAVREPLLRPDELENEKKVVLSEVEGNIADQNRILRDAESRLFFPDAPWRLDPSGAGEVVRNATVADLIKIQQTYYIPNNTALFVGGDVNAEDVYKKVVKLYGSWKRGPDPYAKPFAQQTRSPFSEPKYCVMPFDQCSPQLAQIQVLYRGPDAAFDRNATYAADMFGNFLQNPEGIYKKTMTSKTELQIPAPNYTWENYVTRRESGLIEFGAVVTVPERALPERTKLFLSTIQDEVIKKIISDNSVFAKSDFDAVRQTSEDNRIIEAETASGLLSSLRFWWTVDSADYYYTYNEKMAEVNMGSIQQFLADYISGKNPLVIVLVNPQVYEKQKQAFADAGFTEITADNAFWWKNETGADK